METNSQQDCVNVCQPVGMLALQLANIATTLPPIRLSIKIKKSQIFTKLQIYLKQFQSCFHKN